MSQRNSYYIKQSSNLSKFKIALAWLVTNTKDSSYIALPAKQNLEIIERHVSELMAKSLRRYDEVNIEGKKIQLIHKRKKLWTADNSPILAIYPDKNYLDELDSISNVSAILVVAFTDKEIEQWIRTWGAVELGQSTGGAPSIIQNKVVYVALQSLTRSINLSTGIVHPSDRSRAIQTFEILLKNGEIYDPEEVKSCLIQLGMKATDAENVREIAEKVLEGRRLRARTKMLRDDTIDYWREEAKKI